MEDKKPGEYQGDTSSRLDLKEHELTGKLNGQTPEMEAINLGAKDDTDSPGLMGTFNLDKVIAHFRKRWTRAGWSHLLNWSFQS
jgi:hypothetical protein